MVTPMPKGRDDVVDLLVGEFFGGTEQAVAGVGDDDVDAAQALEGAVDELPDRRAVGHFEHLGDERVGVGVAEVGDLPGSADGADDTVAAGEQLLGEFAAEAAADPGEEPGECHMVDS
jgi:hypothetical protein